MAIKIAINGFGRIGRYMIRACLDYKNIDIVAVNSRAQASALAYLLKYDSIHGKIKADIGSDDNNIIVNGKKIAVTQFSNLVDLPWKAMGIDIPKNPEITIQNIVASADLGTVLNLNAIAIGLGLENIEYEPEQFPGLVYRLSTPKVVMLLFGSGKLVVTGGKKPEDAEAAVEKIVEELDGLGLM